jgi:hypothetical protein
LERGLLFLPDSKSGRKTVILNAPALAVLNGLERVGPYVVPGDNPDRPRPDLKRPWDAVTKRASLVGVRLHTCDTPTRASVPVAGWACRSSANCLVTPKRQRRSDMLTLTPILSAGRPRRLEAGSRQRSMGSVLDQSYN